MGNYHPWGLCRWLNACPRQCYSRSYSWNNFGPRCQSHEAICDLRLFANLRVNMLDVLEASAVYLMSLRKTFLDE